MSTGTATVYQPITKRQGGAGEGANWTPEQKAAYQAQWDNYTRYMAKRQPGQTRDFDATIFCIDAPAERTETYQGVTTTKMKRRIGVQLAEKGVDMLRFYEYSADNPFNDKTLLNKVLNACGIFPKEEEGLTVDFNTLVGKRVRVTLEKQGPRTDGSRGGFWTKLRDIQPVFEDDEPVLAAPAPTVAVRDLTEEPWN